MADYRAVATQAALKYGLPVNEFLRQINQESGFNPTARSGAGAIGIAQFIPSTAREYGVNPLDPVSSLYGAARYDRKLLDSYGTFARALSAYNSGKPDAYLDPNFAKGQTYNYVRAILGSNPAAAGGGAPATPPPAVAPTTAPAAQGIPQEVQAILNQNNRLAGIPDVNYGLPPTLSPSTTGSRVARAPDGEAVVPVGDWHKWVSEKAGADRKGVATKPPVLEFVAKIGRVYGAKLWIGTGSNHNEFVKGTNRMSQHWTGNAADIPSSGDALTRLGWSALIAAGMPRAQAMKQTGGVFNIGRYQILFNTNVGGNHYNHLHVGVR